MGYGKSSFLANVLEEDEKSKLIEQEKIHQIKELIDKRREYATTIKEKFRSSSKLERKAEDKKSNINEAAQKTLKDLRSMSAFDINSKGN
jgi:hypothetical protein